MRSINVCTAICCLFACTEKRKEQAAAPTSPASAAASAVSSTQAPLEPVSEPTPNPLPPLATELGPRRVLARVPNARRIAINGDTVYVTSERVSDENRTDILAVPRKGGPPKLVQARQPSTHALLATKATLFYWSVVDSVAELRKGDGSLFAKPYSNVDGEAVAVGTDIVFFNPRSELVRKPTTGGEETVIAKLDEHASNHPMAADTENVYFLRFERKLEEVVKVPVATGIPVTLTSTRSSINGMATDGAHVYFTTTPGRSHVFGEVWRVSTKGGQAERIATRQATPWPVVLDESYVYWGVENGVMRRAKAGGKEQVVGRSAHVDLSIAVDDRSVYWVGNDSGMGDADAVFRVELPRD